MDEKIHRILDVAKARFQRFGVKKTTMEEIARDEGMSKKTIYEFFDSKEDLFISVFIREALRSRDLLLERVSHIESPLERLEELLRSVVDYHRREPFMIQVLQDADGFYTPYLREEYLLQVEEAVLSLISSIIREGIEKGEFRDLDPHVAAYFFFKLFQAFTYARTSSIKGDDHDLDELVNFIMNGLAKK